MQQTYGPKVNINIVYFFIQ